MAHPDTKRYVQFAKDALKAEMHMLGQTPNTVPDKITCNGVVVANKRGVTWHALRNVYLQDYLNGKRSRGVELTLEQLWSFVGDWLLKAALKILFLGS